MAKTLYLDCFSGASGDMILGALLDLGLPLDDLRGALGERPVDEPGRKACGQFARRNGEARPQTTRPHVAGVAALVGDPQVVEGDRAELAKAHALRVARAFHGRLEAMTAEPVSGGLTVTRHGPARD